MLSTTTLPSVASRGSSRPSGKKPAAASASPAASLSQVYAKIRGTLLKVLVPALCPACKEALAKASTGQALPSGCAGLCKTCKLNLTMKHLPLSSVDKATETAASLFKTRVIAEIEALISRSLLLRGTESIDVPSVASKLTPKEDSEEAAKPEPQLPLPTSAPIYSAFTAAGIDWCRYCGTTAGTSWRDGPWGARTLCFRHGRDWSVHKRLDLEGFIGEPDRSFPVLQGYCKICWTKEGIVRRCYGCANGYHAQCYLKRTNRNVASLMARPWFCNSTCCKHFETGSLRVTHSTKEQLPLMSYDLCAESEDSDSKELLDVVGHESRPRAPSVLIRLKEPSRPLTPVPTVTEPILKEKRRFSCPVETIKPPVKKARRSRDHSVPDFLISIDHSALPKRIEADLMSKKPVLTPEFKVVTRPGKPCGTKPVEKMTELVFETRHARFEETEKHTRLLKPDILRSLFGKAA